MLVSLPRNAAGAHRVFAQGERRQRRWRWEGGVVKQNDSDLNLALAFWKDLLDLLHPGRPRGESFSPFCAGILSGFRAREERRDSDSDRKKSGCSGVAGTH